MGGRMGRPRPMWRPVRIASMKFRSVHWPVPVSLSGVRLAVKLVPQGPDQAVIVAPTEAIHGPGGSLGAGGIAISAGWPESMRVMSGSGPFGPSLSGVWQSWQPLVVTRYSPRLTRAASGPPALPAGAASLAEAVCHASRDAQAMAAAIIETDLVFARWVMAWSPCRSSWV